MARYGVFVRYVMDVTLEAVRIGRCIRAGLFVETQVDAEGLPLDTTTLRCRDCSFRTTEVGPGAEVEGLAIHFEDCIFESNGTGKAERGRGLVVRRGATNVLGGHFENNGDDDLLAGTYEVETKPGEPPKNVGGAYAAYPTVVNAVFRGGTRHGVPPRLATAAGVRCRSVFAGTILGCDFTQVAPPVVLETRGGALARGVSISGCAFASDPEVWEHGATSSAPPTVLPISAFPGFVATTDLEQGGHLLTGNFRLRLGGGAKLWSHWQVKVPVMRVLPAGALLTLNHVLPAEVGLNAAHLRRTSLSVGYDGPSGAALPHGILLTASLDATRSPPEVRVTAWNADATDLATLDGVFRVGIWEHEA